MVEMNKDHFRHVLKQLMDKNGINQTKLSKIIGMPQSNISKSLKDGAQEFFTVYQIYAIAEHFNQSIDEMLGRKNANSYSEEYIARLIVNQIEEHKAGFTEITKDDYYYYGSPYDVMEPQIEHCTYSAIYFRNTKEYLTIDQFTDDEIDDLQMESYNGADILQENIRLNEFIRKFRKLYDLYTHNAIDEDDYRTILNKYYQELSSAD